MKKMLCFLLALVLSVSCFVSCESGTSIAIGALRLDNEVTNLFKFTDAVAYHETVSYQDQTGATTFTATYYYEKAEDIYAVYNLVETIGDYRLYAYEGSIFTETENGMTAVLLLSGTYVDFAKSYLEVGFLLDGDTQLQRSSKTENDVIFAQYEAELTPQQTARASVLGVQEGDKILSTYAVRDSIIESVEYLVERDGKTFPIAKRDIRVMKEKENPFASVLALSEETVSVDFVFVGTETQGRHFEVPKGVFVGMETGTHAYTFYLDAECTQVYSFDKKPLDQSITLYAVEK